MRIHEGDFFPKAHSANELRQQPNLEKTKLCKTFAQDRKQPYPGLARGRGIISKFDKLYENTRNIQEKKRKEKNKYIYI